MNNSFNRTNRIASHGQDFIKEDTILFRQKDGMHDACTKIDYWYYGDQGPRFIRMFWIVTLLMTKTIDSTGVTLSSGVVFIILLPTPARAREKEFSGWMPSTITETGQNAQIFWWEMTIATNQFITLAACTDFAPFCYVPFRLAKPFICLYT